MKFTFVAAQGLTLATETCKDFTGMVGHVNMGGTECFAALGASASSAVLQSVLCCI